LAVNNELVGRVSSILTPGIPNDRPYDDKTLVDKQIKGMWDMVAFVDKQSGGPGRGWMQIAESPEDARRIIKEGKLAIVLGIEVDSLGNWRTPEDLQKQSGNDLNKARALIKAELLRLHSRGVRQIAPIHLTDNAFGGCAVYNKIFSALNKYVAGHFYEVENATSSGVYYNVVRDEFPFVVNTLLTAVASRATDGFGKWESSVSRSGGTANRRGLTKYGEILIEEMMDLGMIIDMDHFSQKALAQALAITERKSVRGVSKYPFVFSHVAFRDLALEPHQSSEIKQFANESHKTASDIQRMRAAGGVLGVGLVQGSLKSFGSKVANDSAGSSKSWAQAYQYAVSKLGSLGVAMGTDVNGGPGAPGPRFGPFASYALHPKTGSRGAARRQQAEGQTKGVRYDGKWKDYRRYRFDNDEGVYDDEERQIWEGLALAKSGANIEDADIWYWNRLDWDDKEVQYFAEGFRAANVSKDDSVWERRAAWLAKTGGTPLSSEEADVHRYFKKARRVWNRWKAMESGPNPPLARSKAGRRDFDINMDGVAHYGLLPDFIQDLKNVGLTDNDLRPLMSSAFAYVTMWDKCSRMTARVPAKPTVK
jgi:microsomal dipeptidase-like Zn-dependent dipeptidase